MKTKSKKRIKLVVFLLLFAALLYMLRGKEDRYYISEIDTYMMMQKTKKGCYISFEKGEEHHWSVKKRDYILVPNVSGLTILYDSIHPGELIIYCVEEFSDTYPFEEFQEKYFNFKLYSYDEIKLFKTLYFDKEINAYKYPYKFIRIYARDNRVIINGVVVNDGNRIGKPS